MQTDFAIDSSGFSTRRFVHGEVEPLDLHETDLRRGNLRKAHLEGAELRGAYLQRARRLTEGACPKTTRGWGMTPTRLRRVTSKPARAILAALVVRVLLTGVPVSNLRVLVRHGNL